MGKLIKPIKSSKLKLKAHSYSKFYVDAIFRLMRFVYVKLVLYFMGVLIGCGKFCFVPTFGNKFSSFV